MRKLVLKRETLRALSGKDLSQVRGALTDTAPTGTCNLSRVKVSCMFIVCN